MDMGSALFAGLHFNRRRFGLDIAAFEGRGVEAAQRPVATGTPEATPQADRSTGARATGDEAGRGGAKISEVERVALLRKRFSIHVTPHNAPAPLADFGDLGSRYHFSKQLLEGLSSLGLHSPTPIQRQAIPVLLEGHECFACAPTGSGKTLAYVLPILHSLKGHSKEAIRALILSPTRELAAQIVRELKRLTSVCKLKVRLLTKTVARCNDLVSAPGCDILVATPLRLSSLLGETRKVDLARVRHVVLDEADKLFEMGFLEQIDAIMAACSAPDVVHSLFSATLPETVERLARTIMHDPYRIVIGERNSSATSVKQELLFVGSEEGKILALRQLLKDGITPPVLLFVDSKERAQHLYRRLIVEEGVANIGVIHADRTQHQRDEAVDAFRAGQHWLLIATDLLGRGMDFKGVNLVINYDFPGSAAAYIHRVGRSGRAGRQGRAITLYTEEDKDSLRSIANIIVASGAEVPAWMLQLPKTRKKRSRPRPQEADGSRGAKRAKGQAPVVRQKGPGKGKSNGLRNNKGGIPGLPSRPVKNKEAAREANGSKRGSSV